MKALRISGYGGRDALEIVDVPRPDPGPGDVLVEVHAASVNPIDWKIREGYMKSFVDIPMPHVMGRDVSGVVFAVGDGVESLSAGDAVYGSATATRDGTHAEYVAIPATMLARKPKRIDHVEAASLPISALSAYAGLVTHGNLAAGEKVLIHAGAGGVGVIAIQLAKHIGATVATTASASNAEYVRELGADIAIDYRTTDFAQAPGDYDLVFDTMGGEIHLRSYAVLASGGRMTYLNADPIPEEKPRDDVTVLNASVAYDTASLERLAELVDDGAIEPRVSAVVPLAEAVSAYDLSQTGHVRGKVVIRAR
jgi:NADPH:quinone reductase-like Zn-dependent oxidoreductase